MARNRLWIIVCDKFVADKTVTVSELAVYKRRDRVTVRQRKRVRYTRGRVVVLVMHARDPPMTRPLNAA